MRPMIARTPGTRQGRVQVPARRVVPEAPGGGRLEEAVDGRPASLAQVLDAVHGLALGQELVEVLKYVLLGIPGVVHVHASVEVGILRSHRVDGSPPGSQLRLGHVVDDPGRVLGADEEVLEACLGPGAGRDRGDEVRHVVRAERKVTGCSGSAVVGRGLPGFDGLLAPPVVVGVHDVQVDPVESRVHDLVQRAGTPAVEQDTLPSRVPVADLVVAFPVGVFLPEPVRGGRVPVLLPVPTVRLGLPDGKVGQDCLPAILEACYVLEGEAAGVRPVRGVVDHDRFIGGGLEGGDVDVLELEGEGVFAGKGEAALPGRTGDKERKGDRNQNAYTGSASMQGGTCVSGWGQWDSPCMVLGLRPKRFGGSRTSITRGGACAGGFAQDSGLKAMSPGGSRLGRAPCIPRLFSYTISP